MTTVFHRLNGSFCLYDYHVRGFLREAARVLNGVGGVKALRSKVTQYLFVEPRRIPLVLPDGGAMTLLERSLRAETARGPRIALVRSEALPAGTALQCKLLVIENKLSASILRELLDYGRWSGLGQWRNASYGRFTYELASSAD